MKITIEEIQNDKSKLVEDINQLQVKLKMNQSQSKGLDSFKNELKSRDELIQKLRQEILTLQEKRDVALAEVEHFFFFLNSIKLNS